MTTHAKTATTALAGTARTLVLPALALGLVLLGPASSAFAQVCGDVNADDQVTASDAQRVLKAAVGQAVELICTDQCAVLEGRVAALEALLAHVTVVGDNLVLSGQNFQVISGSGKTDGTINGTGNIIIGYNESNSGQDKKTGSHNLVIGRYHSYPTYGGIIAGEDNEITGVVASVLGGANNSTDGDGAVVVGGQNNQADGETSVVVAGESNRITARSCSIASGLNNLCSGIAGAISGGGNNFCSGNSAVLSGGTSRILNTNGAWLAGSLFQAQ